MEIKQNTLYLTTSGNYVSRDHLTLRVEAEKQLKLAVPIHHIESICNFGQNTFSPAALQLCWENGVSVNCFSETGYFFGRWEGIPKGSISLRRTQYRKADSLESCFKLAQQFVLGKVQNSRQCLLRSARETSNENEKLKLQEEAKELARILYWVEKETNEISVLRGYEGQAASLYFSVFTLHLQQQREIFQFSTRSRRPPLDRINCLLSFLYALVRNDCVAALTATGLDPFVGFFHTEYPNRPSLALDLMEEFRPILAERLAITLINRKQILAEDFVMRDGGAVELSQTGRKKLVTAYQTRKKDTITHPLLKQEFCYGQLFLVQSRILARYLREDIPQYYPFIIH